MRRSRVLRKFAIPAPVISGLLFSVLIAIFVGTASAFGPIFIDLGAPESATTVGVAAGTMGNIMGSLIGGPVAALLISRHGLKSDPNDKPEAVASGAVPTLSNDRMVSTFALCLLTAAIGMPIYALLDCIPTLEMPKFIGCLFAGPLPAM